MKNKSWLTVSLLLLFVVILSACGNGTSNSSNAASPQASAEATATPEATNDNGADEAASGTVVYESETGPVEIPAQPQRIVALTNAPNVLSLGVTPVGVDQWTGANPLFAEKLQNVAVVSEDDPESVAAQTPDLIIAGAHTKNLDQLAKIAPTVVYTWGKLNYLDQQLEIGKLLNKEAETLQWIEDFTQRAEAVGQQIKAKYGEDVSVSAIEVDANSVFVMGDNWARGTEILYQAMNLAMPDKTRQDTAEAGYYSLSLEVLPEYMGDFIAVSRRLDTDNEIMSSEIWAKIPAVQNGQVIEFESTASSYSDPTTLEYLLDIFEKGFLGEGQ